MLTDGRTGRQSGSLRSAALGRAVAVLCGALLVYSIAAPNGVLAAERFKPFKMKSLEGPQKSLSDVLGKATLVVFFFPTCQFCNLAIPEIQKFYDAYKDRGLAVVFINVVQEEEKLIPEWRSQHGYTVPILIGGRSVQNDYKLTITTTHYLLDAKGQVISRHAGFKPGDEKGLEQEIQQALAQAQ